MVQKPRIAFIDLTFNWPPVGGCWVDLKEIISRLAESGIDTKLFTPLWTDYYPRGEIKEQLPFPVERIPFSRFTFNAWHLRQRFAKALEVWKPDIVFLGDGYHLKPHLLAGLSQKYPTFCRFYAYDVQCLNLHYWLYPEHRICDGGFLTDPNRCHRCWHPGWSFPKRAAKIVLGYPDNHPQLHFTQEYLSSLAFTRWYRKRLPDWLSLAQGLIVYNNFIADFYRPFSSRVHVIPSGVDTRRFQPIQRAENIKPVIFVPGRVNDELKGFEVVRQACQALRNQGLDFEVQITAAFDMQFQEPWIHNLGWVSQQELPALYHRADIAVVPSLWVEPFGITTLEAMASGLPVIGSKIGGIAETLIHGKTGLHVAPGSVEEMSSALKLLIESPDLRKEYGSAGRQHTENVYDWNRLVNTYYLDGIFAAWLK